MTPSKNLQNLSPAETNLNSKIFDLVLGRTLKRAFLNFDERIKQEVEEIYSPKKIKKSSKKYLLDFKKLFEEEAQNIQKEIQSEIQKQL